MSDGFVTVGQCVEGLPLGRFVWEVLLCAFLAWFLLGAINESTPLAFSFISTQWAPDEGNVTMMSAALSFGNFLAIVSGGWMADRFGRLAVLRPALFLTACGMVLLCSRSFTQALLTRFALGVFSGAMLAVVPALVAELLPSKNRGFYLTIWCAGWPAGALFALGTIWLLPGLDWRLFYTMMLLPATILYAFTRAEMLPESPRWLYLAGHREEGYETLMDMYEKQFLPLPWAPETIAVTSGHKPRASARPCACTQGLGVTLWLALAMTATSAATQSMKLWMPAFLIAQQADASLSQFGSFRFAGGPKAVTLLGVVHAPLMARAPNQEALRVLMQGYLFELLGVIAAACCAGSGVSRRSLIQGSLLLAAALTFATLVAADRGYFALCGPLLGLQLAAQATAFNFLQAFVCEHFPTSRRAKASAFVNFTAQLGNFAVPVLGGFVVHQWSAYAAVLLFGSLYLLSWLASFNLPLPTMPEEPLHDVDEVVPRKAKRKAQLLNYQTI